MVSPLESFQRKAPLVDPDELAAFVSREIMTDGIKRHAQRVVVRSSFAEPDRDIDSNDYPSDLDIFVFVPDWDLPGADSGIALIAPQVDVPPIFDRIEEYRWEEKSNNLWNCSAREAWEQLPEYAKGTLRNSIRYGFRASQDDVDAGIVRPYDVTIGGKEYYYHIEDPTGQFEIWTADA